MIRVWESTPENPKYPMLNLSVIVTSRGEVVIADDNRNGYGRTIDPDDIDDFIGALVKAKVIAPKVAEAYEFEQKAEEMVKQARADRIAALEREVGL